MSTLPAVAPHRDLLTLGPAGLVLACDSIGGIGPKEEDTVFAHGSTVGHFVARGPLLELICAGAQPVAVANTLCMAADETGAHMIEGVRSIAREVGVATDAVTGSTEDNVATRSTGVGLTAIGQRARTDARVSLPGDVVVCAGLPRSAPRDTLYPTHPDLVPIRQVQAAMSAGLVHDALPVGSHGVAREVEQLAQTAGLQVRRLRAAAVDIHASGGPSTCVLLSCAAADVERLASAFPAPTPVAVVARLAPTT